MDIIEKFDNLNIKTFKNFKNLKLIIFDFDDTLYRNLSWKGYNEFFMLNIRKIFSSYTDKEFKNLLIKHDYNENRSSETIAKVFLSEFGSTKKLVEFLNSIKYETDWENAILFSQEILQYLNNKYKLIIVSNSSEENINFVSKNIGLDLSVFYKISSNKFNKEDLSKAKVIKDILNLENLKPSQVLMVGDSMEYDILPAKQLGLNTLLLKE